MPSKSNLRAALAAAILVPVVCFTGCSGQQETTTAPQATPSATVSPSASATPSVSPSASASPSATPKAALSGDWVAERPDGGVLRVHLAAPSTKSYAQNLDKLMAAVGHPKVWTYRVDADNTKGTEDLSAVSSQVTVVDQSGSQIEPLEVDWTSLVDYEKDPDNYQLASDLYKFAQGSPEFTVPGAKGVYVTHFSVKLGTPQRVFVGNGFQRVEAFPVDKQGNAIKPGHEEISQEEASAAQATPKVHNVSTGQDGIGRGTYKFTSTPGGPGCSWMTLRGQDGGQSDFIAAGGEGTFLLGDDVNYLSETGCTLTPVK